MKRNHTLKGMASRPSANNSLFVGLGKALNLKETQGAFQQKTP